MKTIEKNEFIKLYLNWIKTNTSVFECEENLTEITTPFLDNHNDALQIYVQKMLDDQYRLTDDSYILSDLEASGLSLGSEHRKRIFRESIAGFGVNLSPSNELFVEANSKNFGQRKHDLLQAMMHVSNMYMLSKNTVYEIFKDDVREFLDKHHIRYSKDLSIFGKSGLSHNFDFIISPSAEAPERLLRVQKTISRQQVDNLILAKVEIDEVRTERFNMLVFTQEPTSAELKSALNKYQITPYAWSQRAESVSVLAA